MHAKTTNRERMSQRAERARRKLCRCASSDSDAHQARTRSGSRSLSTLPKEYGYRCPKPPSPPAPPLDPTRIARLPRFSIGLRCRRRSVGRTMGVAREAGRTNRDCPAPPTSSNECRLGARGSTHRVPPPPRKAHARPACFYLLHL